MAPMASSVASPPDPDDCRELSTDALTDKSRLSLGEIARLTDGSLLGDDASAVSVLDVTQDSREVRPGWLFAALGGSHDDGHRHADEARKAGAAALLVTRPLAVPVPQVVVPSVRAALGTVAAALHGWPSKALTVVGITGTNGKTTTTSLLSSTMDAASWRHGVIGTVEIRVDGRRTPSVLTTPPAPDLQRTLARIRDTGARAVAMEVSSHALDQHRVGAIRFDVGIFLNLSSEHLDYHGTVEQYWASKALLFAPQRCRQALVCTDDAWGQRLAGQVTVPVTTFARNGGADFTYEVRASDLSGTRVTLRGPEESIDLDAPGVIGPWNAPNMVAAYLCSRLLGIPPRTAAEGIERCTGVPGRSEIIDSGQEFLVVVDYAHTPEAVVALVNLGRQLARPGCKVWIVVGATGGRDRFKRPRLGRAAALADVAVLTSDSPASEDPLAIIREVQVGTLGTDTTVVCEADRAKAIALAVSSAGPGDVVLLAGRGHETTQLIGDTRVPIDDRAAARAILRQRGFGPKHPVPCPGSPGSLASSAVSPGS